MGNQPLASMPRAIFERTERTDSCPRAVAKRPPPRRSYYTFLFATPRARAAQSDAVRVHRCRFVFDAPFRSPSRASGERATREFRCILRRRRRRTKRESKNGITKGWGVRTHSRRRSHVETLKLNNSRYLRSSTSSFARFGVRRVAERDFLAPPFTFRRKERASDVHALDVARREPIRAVPLE